MRRECREPFPHYRLQRKLLAIPACITARASRRVVGIANPRWRGKRSRHSRHMSNPQFYVSDKRHIAGRRWHRGCGLPPTDGGGQTLLLTGTKGRQHSIMISSNGNIPHYCPFCAGNSAVTGEFSAQIPMTWSFDVFVDLRLNQQLSKQWRHRWFATLSRSLWRHCNAMVFIH